VLRAPEVRLAAVPHVTVAVGPPLGADQRLPAPSITGRESAITAFARTRVERNASATVACLVHTARDAQARSVEAQREPQGSMLEEAHGAARHDASLRLAAQTRIGRPLDTDDGLHGDPSGAVLRRDDDERAHVGQRALRGARARRSRWSRRRKLARGAGHDDGDRARGHLLTGKIGLDVEDDLRRSPARGGREDRNEKREQRAAGRAKHAANGLQRYPSELLSGRLFTAVRTRGRPRCGACGIHFRVGTRFPSRSPAPRPGDPRSAPRPAHDQGYSA